MLQKDFNVNLKGAYSLKYHEMYFFFFLPDMLTDQEKIKMQLPSLGSVNSHVSEGSTGSPSS